MWISRKRVEEDLQERFGEDYPKVKRYLRMTWYMVIVMLFLMVLAILPYTRQYFWWVKEYPTFLLPLIPLVIVEQATRKKYKISEKLKGSLYRKRGILISIFVILPLFIALLSFWILYKQTPSEAAEEFGRGVQLPTYFPFKVINSSGDAANHDELWLDYEDGVHTLDIWISNDEPKEWDGTIVTLANGTKAWYRGESGDLSLNWYRGGFLYDIILEDPRGEFTETDLLKIANSFQPLESK